MGCFEQHHADAAGRVGELTLPGHDDPLTTPTLLPVINPNIDTLPATAIVDEFDPDGLITNAYVIFRHDDLRERALKEGVHGLLGVDCPIMTDSGSFQLAEYGAIDVDNEEIVSFQIDINSDICTPIDVPTPPGASYDRAAADLETTLARIDAASAIVDDDRLLSAPVQGGSHPSLRESAGRAVRESGAYLFPIGAVVPLMTDYRFAALVEVVIAAKQGLNPAAPVHLFGAGHPMMFALAAALGCDLFDSAAYALYARDDRYLTVNGTRRLDALSEFPCACPVCTEHTPDSLEAADEIDRERLLSRHNLHVSFEEIRRVRAAIRSGNLLELVDRRARAHPAMLDAYRRLLDDWEYLEMSDPVIKDTFLYLSSECAHRPEVHRYHDRLSGWGATGQVVIGDGTTATDDVIQMELRPPFGPIPPGLEHTYPLTAEVPDRFDSCAYEAAAKGVAALADGSPTAEITVTVDGWPTSALERLPETVRTVEHGDPYAEE